MKTTRKNAVAIIPVLLGFILCIGAVGGIEQGYCTFAGMMFREVIGVALILLH